MADDPSAEARRQEYFGEWYAKLVEGVASAYGGKPRSAIRVKPEEELNLWLKPTGPAAKKAYEMGGGDAEAEAANRLYIHARRGQQTVIRQELQRQGATPEQIAGALKEQGLDDESITRETRSYAWELGKQNSGGSPKKEAEYHRKQAERAAQMRGSMMTGGGTDATTTAPGA